MNSLRETHFILLMSFQFFAKSNLRDNPSVKRMCSKFLPTFNPVCFGGERGEIKDDYWSR